jgi:RNA polymerase sigma-70 factor (ECF subfamily)
MADLVSPSDFEIYLRSSSKPCTPMPIIDFYIQKRIKDGDIREFERLFETYYAPLCQHANKILKDMDTAEDLVQEFFYHFWKNRETFTPKVSLGAYLYQSIRNNALHHLQHRNVRENYSQLIIENSQVPFEDEDNLEMKELGKAIQATLQQMPERCAKVFSMNRFEGKKYREIADILSISVKTVEADMGKALQLFRKSLKEYTGEMRINN